MTAEITRQIQREIGSVFSAALDPNPIEFKSADEVGVRPVRNACRKLGFEPHGVRRSLNRNAFLCGCLDFTESEPIEHLIVGLGTRHGATTKVLCILHATGSKSAVSIPPKVMAAIESHLAGAHQAKALLFHNHPYNPINTTLDNDPIASDADRRLWAQLFLHPAGILKALTGGGRVRFYLGENGFVAEFRTPQLLDIIDCLTRHLHKEELH